MVVIFCLSPGVVTFVVVVVAAVDIVGFIVAGAALGLGSEPTNSKSKIIIMLPKSYKYYF